MVDKAQKKTNEAKAQRIAEKVRRLEDDSVNPDIGSWKDIFD